LRFTNRLSFFVISTIKQIAYPERTFSFCFIFPQAIFSRLQLNFPSPFKLDPFILNIAHKPLFTFIFFNPFVFLKLLFLLFALDVFRILLD